MQGSLVLLLQLCSAQLRLQSMANYSGDTVLYYEGVLWGVVELGIPSAEGSLVQVQQRKIQFLPSPFMARATSSCST